LFTIHSHFKSANDNTLIPPLWQREVRGDLRNILFIVYLFIGQDIRARNQSPVYYFPLFQHRACFLEQQNAVSGQPDHGALAGTNRAEKAFW